MHLEDKELAFAKQEGYTVDTDLYGHVKGVHKGRRHIWPVLISRYWMGWQTADLIDGYYCNHRKYKELINALNRPLNS